MRTLAFMPIYMDRHFIVGATQHAIANAQVEPLRFPVERIAQGAWSRSEQLITRLDPGTSRR